MNDLRTAAQQALEAMQYATPTGKITLTDWYKSITALKAALAEPVQEPFCYVYEYDSPYGLHREFYPREYNGMKPSRTVPLYAAPPQRKPEPMQESVKLPTTATEAELMAKAGLMWLEQNAPDRLLKPVQEPVAWLRKDELADLQTCNHRRLGADSPRIWAPFDISFPSPDMGLVAVYTAPPQRKPLTEEAITQCFADAGAIVKGQLWAKVARAIERAHGIT